jgi:hypothetical protein
METHEEAEARVKAEAAASAKAEADKRSLQSVAIEMERLKSEADSARRRIEDETRRKSEESALANEQAKAWAEAEQRAKTQALIESEQAARQASLSQAKAAQKQVSRSPRKPLPLGKIGFLLFLFALISIIVLPYVYPMQEYVAALELRLSANLKQPVNIGGLSAASFPPKLELKNVVIGKTQELKIGTVVLNFDLFSLLSDAKVISNAELYDVSIQGNTIDKQAASLKQLPGDPQYQLRHMSLQRLKIVTDEITVPILSGVADIESNGFSRVSLHSEDNKLSFDLQPNQGHWQLAVNLKESQLQFLPGITFSDLSAKGDLSDGEVSFTELYAHLYDGILLGNAKMNWRNKGWQLQGHIEAKTFELKKMFPALGLDGELNGEGTLTLAGSKLSQIGETPHLDGNFSVKKGVVNGFDMVDTARLKSRVNIVGGRTHFDDMSGAVQLDNHVCRFKQVKITSDSVSAEGLFDVSASNQLGGNFSATLKMREGDNTLTLFGTIAEPKMRSGL